MLFELKQYLKQFTFLSPKDIADFVSVSKVVKYQKGETIFAVGEMSYNMNVVLNGYVRVYITRMDGEERTVYLASRGMGFGSSKTIYADMPGNETAMALETCLVLVVDFAAFRQKAVRTLRLIRCMSRHWKRPFWK